MNKNHDWLCEDGLGDQAEQHVWSLARSAAVRRDNERCIRCGSENRLEVNHILPLDGAGYGPGCEHHADNLETLCHDCHTFVTKAQRFGWVQSATLIPDTDMPLCLALGFYGCGPEVTQYLKTSGWRRVAGDSWRSPDLDDRSSWTKSAAIGYVMRATVAEFQAR